VVPEDAMPIKPEMIQALLNDALQELSEINDRKLQLEALVDNLRKYLKKPAGGAATASGTDTYPVTIIKGGEARTVRFRRRKSHATKIAEIVRESTLRMKIKDVIKAYLGKGWELSSSNAYNLMYRAIKDRPDLFTLTADGYVELKSPEQPSIQEVMS
jgi:hypothetical protein